MAAPEYPIAHEERRAVIADGQPIFRRGLRHIVEQCGVLVVAEVTTVDELHRETRLQDPKVLIVNARLWNDAPAREIDQILSARRCNDGMLLLTIYDDSALAQRMLKAGSHACVHNSADADELKCAINTLLTGGYYLDSRLGMRVLSDESPESRYKLTSRELKVLALIAAGLTNRQIAEKLFVSLRTVESHRSCLKKKIGLRDRSELSEFVRQHYPTMLSADPPFSRH